MKIRKDDHIVVIRGKDKGKKAKVLRGLPSTSMILVEGVNVKKKHQKPRKEGEKGQIVEIPYPIHSFKVKLICPKCSKPTRVGYKRVEKRKYRICKKCNQEL